MFDTNTHNSSLPLPLQTSQEIPKSLILFLFVVSSLFIIDSFHRPSALDHPTIPTVGCPGKFTFYLGSSRFLFRAPRILAAGYAKYRSRLFKTAIGHNWNIVVSGPAYLKDLLDAPDSILSADAAHNDRFQVPYTIGNQLWANAQMIRGLIRQLARDIHLFMPSMIDEISFIVDQWLPDPSPEWKQFGTTDFATGLVGQVNTRVLAGIEKARDPAYLAFIVNFPRRVLMSAVILNWLPRFLRPPFAYIVSVASDYRQGSKYLEPLMELESSGLATEYTTLGRMVEQGRRQNVDHDSLVFRFMMMNFGAMHSSIYTLGHALHHLATMPAVVDVLRAEAEDSVNKRGWTKEGLTSMQKLDSFLRESQRVSALSAVGTQLKAKRPFSFSDGTKIPAGSMLIVPLEAILTDNENFENAKEFDPLRFYNPDPESQTPYTSAGLEYLAWGFGKHTCPGRFYASCLLKSTLAYLLIHCDLRLKDGQTERPEDFWFETNRVPHLTTKIELRRRSV